MLVKAYSNLSYFTEKNIPNEGKISGRSIMFLVFYSTDKKKKEKRFPY